MQRLIIKEMKKRRFFGTSKLEINVTDTGLKMLNSKKQELHQQAEQLRQWKRSGDTTQLQSYMNSDNNRSWVPFMLFAGIMDILFFTSIMSMMGMTLNPMESQMAGRVEAAELMEQEKQIVAGPEPVKQIPEEETLEDLTEEVLVTFRPFCLTSRNSVPFQRT